MTTASHFNTNALYPGGDGKCKVGTADLYPSDPWKVNVSMADLHKWMWNLEEWEVSLDCASVVKGDPSDTEYMDFDLSINGKFHHGLILEGDNGYFYSYGACLFTPPNKRPCGAHYVTIESDSGGPTNTTETLEMLLPSVSMELFHSGGETDPYTRTRSIDVSDGTSTVGNVELSGTLKNFGFVESDGGANLSFRYVRLLGDGTADVHFTADAWGAYSAGLVGITRLSSENDPTSDETATAATISVLGSNFTAYVMTQFDMYSSGLESPGPAPDSFSFTFAITVTTAYTY